MSEPTASDADEAKSAEPLVRAGLWGFLDLQRWDVIAVIVLVVASFALRIASPIFLDGLDHPLSGSPVVAWGLGYPWNATESIPSQTSGKPPCGSINQGGLPVTGAGRPVNNGTFTVQCGFVFDEIYFPPDAVKDLHQPAISYFDPEPPLVKILMTPAIEVFGFNTWGWRMTSALFGSLLVGVIYLIARRLRRDRFFATVAAVLVSLDGLSFVESRLGLIDMTAIFFVALLYYFFLLHWQARTKTQWRMTLYALAGVVGLAFGAKLTGLAPVAVAGGLILVRVVEHAKPWLQWFLMASITCGVLGFVAAMPLLLLIPGALIIGGVVALILAPINLFDFFPFINRIKGERSTAGKLWFAAAGKRAWLHYGLAGLLAVLVFCGCWARYLTVSHDDVYNFVSCSRSAGGVSEDPNKPTFSVPQPHGWEAPVQAVEDIVTKMKADLQYHSVECHSHPYQSRWFAWPVTAAPVLLYRDTINAPDGTTGTAGISNMGNPAIWWLGIAALLFCAWRMTAGPRWWRLGVLGIGLAGIAIMMVTFIHAIHYVNPTDQTTVYNSVSAFEAAVNRPPSAGDEIASVAPGALFNVGFALSALFTVLAGVSAVLSRKFVPGFIVMAWMLAWLMWIPGNEKRVLFFYHALGMLLLVALALAYALTALRRSHIQFGSRTISLAPLSWAGIAVVVTAFVFFYPIWTGMPLSPADYGIHAWFNG